MSSIFNKLIPTIAQGASKWMGYTNANGGAAMPMRESGIASFKMPTDSIASVTYPSGGIEPTIGASQAEDTSLLTYSDLVEAPVSGGQTGSTTAVFNLATSFRNYYLLDKFICYADIQFTPTSDCPRAALVATRQPGGNSIAGNNSVWYAYTNYVSAAGAVDTTPGPVASREMNYMISSPEFMYSWFNQIQFRYGNTVLQQWVNPSCDVILRADSPHNQLVKQGKILYSMDNGLECGIGVYRKPELLPAAGVFNNSLAVASFPRLRWKLSHPFQWTPAKTLPSGAIHSLGITFYYTNNPSANGNTHFFAIGQPCVSVQANTAVGIGSNPIYDTTWAFTKNYISSFSNFNISSITISQNSTYHDASPVLDLQMNIPIVNWQLVNQQAVTLAANNVTNQTTSIVFESRFPQYLAIVSDVYLNIGSSIAPTQATNIKTKMTGYLPIAAVRYLTRNNNKYAYWRFIEDQIASQGTTDISAFTALVRHRNAEVSGLIWNSRADVDENTIGGNLLAKNVFYDGNSASCPTLLEKVYRGPAQAPVRVTTATSGINLGTSDFNVNSACVSITAGTRDAYISLGGNDMTYTRDLLAQRITYCPVIQPHDAIKLNNTGNGTLQINYDLVGYNMCPLPSVIPGVGDAAVVTTTTGGNNVYFSSGTPTIIDAKANIYIYAAYYNNVTLGNNVEAVQQDMSDIFAANRAM